jgi:hypothetical protein
MGGDSRNNRSAGVSVYIIVFSQGTELPAPADGPRHALGPKIDIRDENPKSVEKISNRLNLFYY